MAWKRRSGVACLVGMITLASVHAQPNFDGPVRERPAAKPPAGDAAAGEYKPVPLAQAAKTTRNTAQAMMVEFSALERDAMLEAYRRAGRRDERWNAQAEEFLKQTALLYGGHWQAPTELEILEQGRKVLALGCDDPMVRCIVAVAEANASNNEKKCEEPLRTSIDEMARLGYPPLRCGIACIRLGDYYAAWKRDHEASSMYAKGIDHLVKAAARREASKLETHYAAKKILPRIESMEIALAESMWRQIQSAKDVPEWLRLVVDGHYQVRAAWIARGNGYANTVSGAAWRDFDNKLAAARVSLEKAHALRPECSEAASKLVTVAMAGESSPGKPTRYWFDQAVAAVIDSDEAYSHYLTALQPKWEGSYPEMQAFARECASVKRYDTSVPRFALRAYTMIATGQEDYTGIWREKGVYETCKSVCEGYLAEKGMEGYKVVYATWLAAIATRAEKWDDARAAMDSVDGQLAADMVHTLHFWPADVVSAVYPRTDPATKELVRKADDAADRREWHESVEWLEKAKAAAPTKEATRVAVADMLASARVREAAHSDEWMDIALEPGLAGWRLIAGEGFKEEDGDLIVRPFDHTILLLAQPVGDRFEMEAFVNFGETDKESAVSGGIMFGHEWRTSGKWMAARLWPDSQTVTVARGWNKSNLVTVPALERREGTLRLQWFDNQLVVRVDDKVVYEGKLPIDRPGSWTPGDRVGLCAWGNRGGVAVEFRNIVMRRLKAPPSSKGEAKDAEE